MGIYAGKSLAPQKGPPSSGLGTHQYAGKGKLRETVRQRPASFLSWAKCIFQGALFKEPSYRLNRPAPASSLSSAVHLTQTEGSLSKPRVLRGSEQKGLGDLLEKQMALVNGKNTHLNRWNPSVFSQTNLKRPSMETGDGSERGSARKTGNLVTICASQQTRI